MKNRDGFLCGNPNWMGSRGIIAKADRAADLCVMVIPLRPGYHV